MMGERSATDRLFAADTFIWTTSDRETLYGYLAQHRGQLFRDERLCDSVLPEQMDGRRCRRAWR